MERKEKGGTLGGGCEAAAPRLHDLQPHLPHPRPDPRSRTRGSELTYLLQLGAGGLYPLKQRRQLRRRHAAARPHHRLTAAAELLQPLDASAPRREGLRGDYLSACVYACQEACLRAI